MTEPFILITGLPRSGTTATARVVRAALTQAGGTWPLHTPEPMNLENAGFRQALWAGNWAFLEGWLEGLPADPVGVKCPLAWRGVEHLETLLDPRPLRVVSVYRDPQAVVASEHARHDGDDSITLDRVLSRQCGQWTTLQTSRVQVHSVSYENLLTRPEREGRALLDFLGLEWHDDLAALVQKPTGATDPYPGGGGQ